MDGLRKPLFVLAVILIALAMLLEAGARFALNPIPKAASGLSATPPGYGIPYMALLDGMVLFTVILMGTSLLLPEAVQGRLQGVLTLIVSLLVLIGSIVLVIVALVLLALMVCLLLAVPFGTLVYMAVYSHFDRSGSQVVLGLLMLLKLGFGGCLLASHQGFIKNKGLVLLVLSTLVAQVIVSFLQSVVPLPLVSITDTVGAIVVGIIAAIWSLFFLIGSIVSVVKALRGTRGLA